MSGFPAIGEIAIALSVLTSTAGPCPPGPLRPCPAAIWLQSRHVVTALQIDLETCEMNLRDAEGILAQPPPPPPVAAATTDFATLWAFGSGGLVTGVLIGALLGAML